MSTVKVPHLPTSVISRLEIIVSEDLPIYVLFDEAKSAQDEKWAQWTLANPRAVSTAWITGRYKII